MDAKFVQELLKTSKMGTLTTLRDAMTQLRQFPPETGKEGIDQCLNMVNALIRMQNDNP